MSHLDREILKALNYGEPLRLWAVAMYADCDMYDASKVLRDLEGRGMVERSGFYFTITDGGRLAIS